MSTRDPAISAGPGKPLLQQRVAGAFGLFTSWMNSLGTVWVFGLMLLVCADIIGRNIFLAPIVGVTEVLSYSMVGIVFLQVANTLYVGRFTRAELVITWLEEFRPTAGSLLSALFSIVGAAVFLGIAILTWPEFVAALESHEVDGMPNQFTILVWPFRFIVVAGAAATAVVFAINAAISLANLIANIRSDLAPDSERRSGWPALAAFAAVILAAVAFSNGGPTNAMIGLVSVLFLVALIGFGMHIGVALIVVGYVGIFLIRSNPAIAERVVLHAGNEFLRNHVLAVIPLFVMMGLLVGVSDIGRETFDVARWALRRIKGGLGIATVVANAIFAAITGSSIASAAVFTKIASPEMVRHGYTRRFAVGVVAGTSVLGMLIPPSLLLIIYGFLSEQSVGILFLAAIVPGIILAVAMALGILFMAYRMPDFVGGHDDEGQEAETILSSAIKLFPIALLIFVVLGGIYGGYLTPAESGAAGAAGALIIAVARRKLDLSKLWQVLVETGHVTVAILFLILAANIYSTMISMSGLPQHTSELIASAGLGFYGFMAVFILLLILLGMVLDSVSIMLIILPLALPVVQGMGGDLIWFGIVSVVAVEIGLLTPPVGLTCYVVKSTIDDPKTTLGDIFIGAFPFVIIMLLVTILLVLVPELSTVFT